MTIKGTLFLVVGPSGVGKDTLLDGAREVLGGYTFYRFCQRYITRDAAAGGEDYLPVSETEFSAMLDQGAFFHHWDAHGLRYGVPKDVLDDLDLPLDKMDVVAATVQHVHVLGDVEMPLHKVAVVADC